MSQAIADRYQLEAELARGSAGTVHRARDLVSGETVAVKVLHADAAADPEIAAAFLDEAEVLAELDHPGIVRPRDLIVEGAFMALVMDLVEGVDLRRMVQRSGPLSAQHAARTAGAVAQALAAVHAAGIVHGDVKPGNILIPTAGGHARLVDFGVARRAAAPDAPAYGTPDYTAPEIIEGRPSSAKSDVYGLGLLLFEAVCGRSPYRGGTVEEVLRRHRASVPVRPDCVPVELWTVLESCLSLNPNQRPAADSIAPMLRAVDQLLPDVAAAPLHAVELRAREPESEMSMPPDLTVVPGQFAAPILEVGAGLEPRLGAPETSVQPPVSVPLSFSGAKRGSGRTNAAVLAGVAAGAVALALGGVLMLAGDFGSSATVADTSDSSVDSDADDDTDDSGGEDEPDVLDDEDAANDEDDSTSADSEDSDVDDGSTGDGDAGDDPGNEEGSGESDTDLPGEDLMGSELPGAPGGN